MVLEILGFGLGVGTCAFWWGYTYGVEHGKQDAVKQIRNIAHDTVEASMAADGWVKP